MSDTFCINLYKGIRCTNSGNMGICCKSDMLLHDNGEYCKIDTHDFLQAMNSSLAQEIRNDLERGIKHDNCKKCWDEEIDGFPSKRILDNQRALQNWGEDFVENKIVEPVLIELNLGSYCNLKCRTCGPWSSSRWVQEEFDILKLQGNPISKTDYMNRAKTWQGNYSDDSPAWNNIKKHLSTYKQIDIYGGEPFLVQRQWEILQESIDLGYSKDQIVHFNTNGTQYNPAHIELLKHFKEIRISLSIDALENRFEYMRHPAKWDEVSKNIELFLELDKQNENIHVSACVTVGILNVLYLPEIIHHFNNIGLDYHTNMLHQPEHYNIRNIPESGKTVISDILQSAKSEMTRQIDKDRLEQICEILNSSISNQEEWNNFLEYTKHKDKLRSEVFKETFPELYSITVGNKLDA